MNVHIKVIEPEGALLRRVFVLSSPVISTFNWRKILPEMNQAGALTVVMDLPGFGQSACGPGAPQDNRTRASLAWGVIDEIDAGLGEEGAWHLMGHGSACQVLMDMANLHPDSVSSQIYICPLLAENWLHTGGRDPRGMVPAQHRKLGGVPGLCGTSGGQAAGRICGGRHAAALSAPGGGGELFADAGQPGTAPAPAGICPGDGADGGKGPPAGPAGDGQDAGIDSRGGNSHPEDRRAAPSPMETHSHALRDYIRGWMNYVG